MPAQAKAPGTPCLETCPERKSVLGTCQKAAPRAPGTPSRCHGLSALMLPDFSPLFLCSNCPDGKQGKGGRRKRS